MGSLSSCDLVARGAFLCPGRGHIIAAIAFFLFPCFVLPFLLSLEAGRAAPLARPFGRGNRGSIKSLNGRARSTPDF